MIPNFIWFAVSAPNDVLRADSVTEVIDTIASICQVLMVIALCILVNRKSHKFYITPLIILVIICCLLYFASWGGYYVGIVNIGVILGLTIFPCLAFMFFAIDRKNMIAIFIPEGMEKPQKSIIEQPEFQVYIADFGKADDWCLVAEAKEKIVGTVWVRIMNDYGHIDDKMPSLAISLYEEYRHLGLGTALMRAML